MVLHVAYLHIIIKAVVSGVRPTVSSLWASKQQLIVENDYTGDRA